MKKFTLIFTLMISIFFTGCFGGDGTTATDTEPGKSLYESIDFSITIPFDWEIIEKEAFTSNVPEEIIVAFRNNIKNEVFTANLNVSKKILDTEISSMDFAKSTLSKEKNTIVGFQGIATENYTFEHFGEDIKTYISTFEGKQTAQSPITVFKQLYVVNGVSAYTVTASYLPTEDESVVIALGEMLHSFSLK